MRIVQVEKQRKWAGQTRQGFLLAKGLHERGCEVLVVCQPESAIGERSAECGIPVLHLPMQGRRLFPSAARLAVRLRRDPCDVIHAHGARDHLLAILAATASRGIRLVRTKHNLTPMAGSFLYGPTTHRFVAVSRAAAETLTTAGMPPTKIAIIHDGIDLEEFSPRPPDPAMRAALGIRDGEFVVGVTGRLSSKSKGIPTLLRAFRSVVGQEPDTRLLLAGRQDPGLRELAASLGLRDRVVFTGFRADVADVLACIDLYVQPSVREALSSSILEAMAMEKPVVASDVGGVPEAVVPEETGLLCRPGDPDDLARAILKLMKESDRLEPMGRRARERVRTLFSLDRMVGETERLYRELIESR